MKSELNSTHNTNFAREIQTQDQYLNDVEIAEGKETKTNFRHTQNFEKYDKNEKFINVHDDNRNDMEIERPRILPTN